MRQHHLTYYILPLLYLAIGGTVTAMLIHRVLYYAASVWLVLLVPMVMVTVFLTVVGIVNVWLRYRSAHDESLLRQYSQRSLFFLYFRCWGVVMSGLILAVVFAWMHQLLPDYMQALLSHLSLFFYVICGVLTLAALMSIVLGENLHEIRLRNAQTENQLLKSQLNPHFLYNTLNNIDALIWLDQERASTAVTSLSSLMRYMTYGTRQESVPLADELSAIRQLCSLQSLRFTCPDALVLELPVCGDTPSPVATAPEATASAASATEATASVATASAASAPEATASVATASAASASVATASAASAPGSVSSSTVSASSASTPSATASSSVDVSPSSSAGKESLTLPIAPLLLIPLVENCFKHCPDTSHPGAIIIRLSVEGRTLHFTTDNAVSADTLISPNTEPTAAAHTVPAVVPTITEPSVPHCVRHPLVPHCVRKPLVPHCVRQPSVPHCVRRPLVPHCVRRRVAVPSPVSSAISSPLRPQTSGVGLATLRRRLELLYPGRYTFTAGLKDGRFQTSLTVSC